jgi:hypothetical protein
LKSIGLKEFKRRCPKLAEPKEVGCAVSTEETVALKKMKLKQASINLRIKSQRRHKYEYGGIFQHLCTKSLLRLLRLLRSVITGLFN